MTDAPAPINPGTSATPGLTSAHDRHTAFSPEIPLWKILEEEYEAVHGQLPDDYCLGRNQKLQAIKVRDRILRVQAENEAIVPLLYGRIHALPEKRSALC